MSTSRLWLAGGLLAGILFLTFDSSSAQKITPYANSVSVYKNIDDFGHNRGKTLQIISVNGFNLGTRFNLEFNASFNWGLDLVEKHDYFIGISVVKPVYKMFSLNYQRIWGTFIAGKINQVGARLSFF